MDNQRHSGMHGISTGLKIVAWIVLIVGLIAAIAAAVGAQEGAEAAAARGSEAGILGARYTGIAGAALSAVMALVWFLVLYALADALILLLDIEQSTRLGAERMATVSTATRPAVTETTRAPAGPPVTAPG